MKFGNITIGKQLLVGWGLPKALGKGKRQIRGSAYVEGPLQVGNDKQYKKVEATVMIGEEDNNDALIDAIPTSQDIEDGNDPKQRPTNLSLKVKGNVVIEGDDKTDNALKIDGDTDQTGNITASENITTDSHFIGDITQTSGTPPGCKLFDIQHPTKEGHRLAHACIEGPEVAVYTRGRVCNGHNVIELPEYWRGLINYESLTIQLTAIHSHQNVIVKRISPIDGRIYLQSQGGMPVDCFYHIMAERVDVEKLIVEYEGKTPADYPGDNSGYSIAGYNYDVRS
jgi:hypothetical protein